MGDEGNPENEFWVHKPTSQPKQKDQGKGKGHPSTGTEALYRSYGLEGK